jgi:hypothetical protein
MQRFRQKDWETEKCAETTEGKESEANKMEAKR